MSDPIASAIAAQFLSLPSAEGNVSSVYEDNTGIATIGVGYALVAFNTTTNLWSPVSLPQMEQDFGIHLDNETLTKLSQLLLVNADQLNGTPVPANLANVATIPKYYLKNGKLNPAYTNVFPGLFVSTPQAINAANNFLNNTTFFNSIISSLAKYLALNPLYSGNTLATRVRTH